MNHRRLLTKSVNFSKREQLPAGPNLAWRIDSGFVRAVSSERLDRMISLGIWGPEEYVSATIPQHFSCKIECLTDVTLEPISLKSIDRNLLLLRYIKQTETLLDIALKRQVGDRIVALFSWLSNQFGESRDSGILITVPLTHQDIADLIGTSREAVTRFLRVMEEKQQIYFEDRLIIFNVSVLAKEKMER
ncbi:MAG: Crp/Fnr family transcriptional regulator [Cyanobacteria bacterium P01_E01_bin.45]